MIGLYVHVPFCRTKCPYCDFVSVPVHGAPPGAFLDALECEIRSFTGPGEADSVFVGGGTPSLLAPAQLSRLLGALRGRFRLTSGAEVTLEANPDDVDGAKVQAWLDAGVNRVSLGVQSFDDAVLAYLGRRHDATTACRACEAVATRFGNWSMDLIFGVPVHDAPTPMDAWASSLRTSAEFQPAHVSAYGLTYEEGTPFASRVRDAVDEDTYLAMYRMPDEVLDGFQRYEVSNLARPGFQCRHNLTYWRNEEYAGFGPAAYSFVDGTRARNPDSIEAYLTDPCRKAGEIALEVHEMKTETLIQHFRLREGIDSQAYRRRFDSEMRADFPALRELVQRGLLECTGTRWRPTARGFELNDEIGLALVK